MQPSQHRDKHLRIFGVVVGALLVLVGCSKSASAPSTNSTTSQAATSSTATSTAPALPLHDPDVDVALRLGDAPQNPFVAFGSVWVPAHHQGAVLRINAKTGKLIVRIKTGVQPGNVAASANKVWVAHYAPVNGVLIGIDPATNKIVNRVKLPGESCCQPAVLGSTVWITSSDNSGPGIVAVNAVTGKIGKRIAGVDGPVVVDGKIWASQSGALVIVDTATGATTPVAAPADVVITQSPPAQGLTWVWDAVKGAVYGFKDDGTLGRTVMAPGGKSLGGGDGEVLTSGDTVWVTDGAWTMWRIDAGATAAVQVARTDQDLLSLGGDGHGGVWVTFFNNNKLQHFAGPG